VKTNFVVSENAVSDKAMIGNPDDLDGLGGGYDEVDTLDVVIFVAGGAAILILLIVIIRQWMNKGNASVRKTKRKSRKPAKKSARRNLRRKK
jgi:hypothetical protein